MNNLTIVYYEAKLQHRGHVTQNYMLQGVYFSWSQRSYEMNDRFHRMMCIFVTWEKVTHELNL
jgi:hypothetical protein